MMNLDRGLVLVRCKSMCSTHTFQDNIFDSCIIIILLYNNYTIV